MPRMASAIHMTRTTTKPTPMSRNQLPQHNLRTKKPVLSDRLKP
jgi:hypothetical protein